MAICDKRYSIGFLVNDEDPIPTQRHQAIPRNKPASPKRSTKSKDSNRLWSEKDIEYLLNKITPDILEFLAPNEKETLWHNVADRLDRTVIAIQKKYYKLIQSGILLPKSSRESLTHLNRKLKIKSNNYRKLGNKHQASVFTEYPSVLLSNQASTFNNCTNTTNATQMKQISQPIYISQSQKHLNQQYQDNFYNELTADIDNQELPHPQSSRSSSPFFEHLTTFQ
ncbi:hypothetical protein PPL_10061 [Heterostelium album PN500]|uniref:Uncharacterized protein n=1 Tax=Heterostelium pallidum (strain ATCC 26659 / Pp 5 / PN500) TaxID=670386 RepID=D3BQ78_HETP5|nr:hypothetical protein PPL_10061 [Heterostelium album PN500]EFA76298.1 hypothetical protein PPL_10061 [Heterostelium album PN500]|eukprot:XP_020428430.1 hypothetical protein PPL_10061 [Heterostelium album PN500]